jgi:hypothetical protein
MTGYTAPASKVFTEAHIPGTEVDGDGRQMTVCGLPMDPAECWLPVELRPGDRVHQACEQPDSFICEQGQLL